MIEFDVQRAMEEKDYPVLRIAGEFVALERYLGLLDRFVPHIKVQTTLAEKARLRNKYKSWSRADLQDYYDELEWVTESLVPRFFHGSYVLAVVAAVESALKDLVDFSRSRSKIRLKFSDLKDRRTREAYELYLETLLHMPLKVPSGLTAKIDNLFLVRNCIAHANGDLAVERDGERKKQIQRLASQRVGISIRENEVLVEERFLSEGLSSSTKYVNALVSQVMEAFPAS